MANLSLTTSTKLEALSQLVAQKAQKEREAAEIAEAIRQGIAELQSLPTQIAALDAQYQAQALEAVKSLANDLVGQSAPTAV